MSSVGQALGGVVGGVVGFFVGGPSGAYYGAQAGMMIGGAIDPPKGPTIRGPRLDDLNVQTATYGAFIPRCYATVATLGNVFWVQGDKLIEVMSSTTSGGKGGPSSTSETFSYFASFAVGLCEGPIGGVRRIWIGNQLFYDAGSDDIDAIFESNRVAAGFNIYLGTDTQEADPLIQADKGVGDTPAYRGLAYIVFERLPLEKYSNSIAAAQVKVEVVQNPALTYPLIRRFSNTATGTDSDHTVACNPFSRRQESIDAARQNTFSNTYHPKISVRSPNGSRVWYDITDDAYPLNGEESPLFPSYEGNIKNACQVSADTVDYAFDWAYGYGGTFGTEWRWLIWGSDPNEPHGVYLGSEGVNASTSDRFKALAFAEKDGVKYCLWVYPVVPGLSWDLYIARISDGPTVRMQHDKIDLLIVDGGPDTGDGALTVWGDNAVTAFRAGSTGDVEIKVYGLVSSALEMIDSYTVTAGTFPNSMTSRTATAYVDDDKLYVYTIQPRVSLANQGRLLVVDLLNKSSVAEYELLDDQNKRIESVASMVVQNDLVFIGYRPYIVGQQFVHNAWNLNHIESVPQPLSDIIQTECLKSNLLELSDLDLTDIDEAVRGYRVSALGAIRSGLDPLRTAWPFDVVQHGYTIKFIRRGSTSVATIEAADLDARPAGSGEGARVTESREMDSVLQRKVTLRYMDVTREYDINEQYAERINTDAVNESAVELPLVLNADEAANAAQALLYLYWMERYDVKITLPPTYSNLEPGDVITLNAEFATYSLRLVSLHYLSDGRVECVAKYNDSSVYTPAASGEEGVSTGQTMSFAGSSEFEPLDIPLMLDDYDTAGFPVAMSGYSNSWPGGFIYNSDDGGVSWSNIATVPAPGTVMGTALNALAASISSVYDFSSMLTIQLIRGELSSVTEAQLFSGQNAFAYGVHGRWEIIAARNAVLQIDGTYILSDLLRGQRGTEWATGLHAVGDSVILLSASSMDFVSVNSSSIGTQRLINGATIGDVLDETLARTFIYDGANLECLSPVHVTGSRHPTTNDWTISWVRRSRYESWLSYTDSQLGEASESYEVDIMDGASVVRTIASASNSVVYTADQQTEDFGGSTFSALLHFDGADGSTTFVEESGKVVTVYGNAQIDDSVVLLDGECLLLDGSGDYLTIPSSADLQFGSSNFVVECMIRLNNWATNNGGYYNSMIVCKDVTGGREFTLNLVGTASSFTSLQFIGFRGNADYTIISAPFSFALNTNYWIELSRVGNLIYISVNGVILNPGGTAFVGTLQATSTPVKIGANEFDATYKYYFNGRIDELRIRKGATGNTTDFTPPSAPFTFALSEVDVEIYQLSATVGRGRPAIATIDRS